MLTRHTALVLSGSYIRAHTHEQTVPRRACARACPPLIRGRPNPHVGAALRIGPARTGGHIRA